MPFQTAPTAAQNIKPAGSIFGVAHAAPPAASKLGYGGISSGRSPIGGEADFALALRNAASKPIGVRPNAALPAVAGAAVPVAESVGVKDAARRQAAGPGRHAALPAAGLGASPAANDGPAVLAIGVAAVPVQQAPVPVPVPVPVTVTAGAQETAIETATGTGAEGGIGGAFSQPDAPAHITGEPAAIAPPAPVPDGTLPAIPAAAAAAHAVGPPAVAPVETPPLGPVPTFADTANSLPPTASHSDAAAQAPVAARSPNGPFLPAPSARPDMAARNIAATAAVPPVPAQAPSVPVVAAAAAGGPAIAAQTAQALTIPAPAQPSSSAKGAPAQRPAVAHATLSSRAVDLPAPGAGPHTQEAAVPAGSDPSPPAGVEPDPALSPAQPAAAASPLPTTPVARPAVAPAIAKAGRAESHQIDPLAQRNGGASTGLAASLPSANADQTAMPTVSTAPESGALDATTHAAASAGAATPAPPSPAAGVPPATQVAQGLATVHFAAAAAGSGTAAGAITINLHPGSLGAVQVRIERAADGAASITLQAEKPETLRILQQDSAHLHQALDHAGLFAQGREFVFTLSQSGSASGSPQAGFQSSGQAPQHGMGQNAFSGGSQHGSNNGAGNQQGGAAQAPRAAGAPNIAAPISVRTTAPGHSGINITA